jgi:heme/copper-type cytochrome/quinol oxidase subunit 2
MPRPSGRGKRRGQSPGQSEGAEMNSNVMRVIAGIGVVAVAIVLLVVLKDDDKSASEKADESATTTTSTPGGSGKSSKPSIPTIVIKNGKPVGGITELTYNEGDQIRFKVASDVSDEIHVHGYELMKDVEAGGSVSFDFPATIEGVFEAELEGRKEQIIEFTVNP